MKQRIKKIAKKILKKDMSALTPEERAQLDLERQENERMQEELKEVQEAFAGKDRDHVWAFIAGQFSQDFRGNPKYLFVYINKYRPDIETYWLTSTDETIEQVRSLGYRACKLEEPAAQYAIDHTGVLVVEQVKEYMPEGFENVKYLNLWHGVGFKRIERKLFAGDIALGISRKYIRHSAFLRDNQLMVVTSPTIEKDFVADCGLDEKNILRTGYLRCEYQNNFEPIQSFDHDLKKRKGLSSDAKMVVYAPTYRAALGGTFSRAMQDLEALYRCCEKNNILFIFKVHPNMEDEVGFLEAWENYGERPHFLFWNNQDDFYEVMDRMDLAIVDYSAIFSDMVAVGIKKFIRYVFDFDEYMENGLAQDEFDERTAGELCYSFEELLTALDRMDTIDNTEELSRLHEVFWAYAGGKDDFDKVIKQTLDFKIEKRNFPNLYSFDIFDTLFTRKVLDPMGIFYYVREKMQEEGSFSFSLTHNYPVARHSAEFNMREYYQKTQDSRNSDHIEIHFEEIFDRLAKVYCLDDRQKQLLMKWELEAELDNVIPLPEQIEKVKNLVAAGETVVLISDMYLSKEFIQEMLKKADPMLVNLPLFLSSEYGVQKTTCKLFFEVYKSFEPFYDFKQWIHHGDNEWADQNRPRTLGIKTRLIHKPEFNDIQQQQVESLQTYDAYLVAAMQTILYEHAVCERDEFVASYIALCMVPYVDWALRDSMRRGYETIYFISRDGHPLKRIADALIEENKWPLKTKYIYASRRAWRTPSYITEVDGAFWEPYGNFADITSKDKLYRAMELDEEKFKELFPFINPDTIDYADKKKFHSLLEIFKASKPYNEYLLQVAEERRELVCGYLKQEIDATEKIAFIEYWGRGYTQDCMVRLWHHIVGEEVDVPYYYSRSIVPTVGASVRHNFITNNAKQLFVESFFANMPYKSVENYEVVNGKIEPVLIPIECDESLFDSMERILPEFARQYAALGLSTPEETDRLLYEFALTYYEENLTNPYFANAIGSLVDSVALYGRKREYAPPYTMENLDDFQEKIYGRGAGVITTSISMSYTRTEKDVKERYDRMYQIFPEDNVAGNYLLDVEKQEENEEYRLKYKELVADATRFRNLYQNEIEQTQIVPNRVLLVTNGKTMKDNSALGRVRLGFKDCKELEILTLCMQDLSQTMEEKAALVATVRYLIVDKAISMFCKTKFRPETDEMMLCLSPFHLYNQGFRADYWLKWHGKYDRLATQNDISVLQIPSPQMEDIYRASYCPKSEVRCDLLGCCNTDGYYEEAYIRESREMVRSLIPDLGDRKVILYAPTIRERKDCKKWMKTIDLDILNRLVGDEYAVVMHVNRKQIKKSKFSNPNIVPGFSTLIKKGVSIFQLIAGCDVVIGDYRDIFFHAVFFHKPVYSTAFDYELQYMRSKNLTDYREWFEDTPLCPVVLDAYELAEQLKNADNYDYTRLEEFKQKYLSGCDGESTKRLVEYVKREING